MSTLPDKDPYVPPIDQPDWIDIELVPRARDIGDFEVRRLLPYAKRRMVGPFVFFDHMGPVTFGADHAMDVRPHPHIGLATVTYLFEGEIMHRDSLGSEQVIKPGEVNWMTAGRGIVHSERTPVSLRGKGTSMHGLQTWVALPKSHEETEPAFFNFAADRLPKIEGIGTNVTVIAGEAWGETSPVKVFTETLYADIHLAAGARIDLPRVDERAIYVLKGSVRIRDRDFDANAFVVFAKGSEIVIEAMTDSHLVVVGGETMDGPRHIWWNLVSSSQDRIEQAKADWKGGRFPTIPGDDKEFIPLPE
jgi:redox-sensitive bicupin YhaK (pirin superfamily)